MIGSVQVSSPLLSPGQGSPLPTLPSLVHFKKDQMKPATCTAPPPLMRPAVALPPRQPHPAHLRVAQPLHRAQRRCTEHLLHHNAQAPAVHRPGGALLHLRPLAARHLAGLVLLRHHPGSVLHWHNGVGWGGRGTGEGHACAGGCDGLNPGAAQGPASRRAARRPSKRQTRRQESAAALAPSGVSCIGTIQSLMQPAWLVH